MWADLSPSERNEGIHYIRYCRRSQRGGPPKIRLDYRLFWKPTLPLERKGPNTFLTVEGVGRFNGSPMVNLELTIGLPVPTQSKVQTTPDELFMWFQFYCCGTPLSPLPHSIGTWSLSWSLKLLSYTLYSPTHSSSYICIYSTLYLIISFLNGIMD